MENFIKWPDDRKPIYHMSMRTEKRFCCVAGGQKTDLSYVGEDREMTLSDLPEDRKTPLPCPVKGAG